MKALVNAVGNHADFCFIHRDIFHQPVFGEFRSYNQASRIPDQAWDHPSIPGGKFRREPFRMIERREIVQRDYLVLEEQRAGIGGTPQQARADPAGQPALLPDVALEPAQRPLRRDGLELLSQSRAQLADVALNATHVRAHRSRIRNYLFVHTADTPKSGSELPIDLQRLAGCAEAQEKYAAGTSSRRSSADITQNHVAPITTASARPRYSARGPIAYGRVAVPASVKRPIVSIAPFFLMARYESASARQVIACSTAQLKAQRPVQAIAAPSSP